MLEHVLGDKISISYLEDCNTIYKLNILHLIFELEFARLHGNRDNFTWNISRFAVLSIDRHWNILSKKIYSFDNL